MSTITDTMNVLIEHTRINGIHGDCSCGVVVPLGRRFTEHQAEELHKAGLLRDAPANAVQAMKTRAINLMIRDAAAKAIGTALVDRIRGSMPDDAVFTKADVIELLTGMSEGMKGKR